MNIQLTDLNSLSLDLQEVPALAPEGDDSFTRLLRQQLPGAIDQNSQAVDFKEFFLIPSMTAQDLQKPSSGPVGESWQDYLARQQIRVTVDAEPLPQIPLAPVADFDSPVAGKGLPGGGNSLPQAELMGAEFPLPDGEKIALRMPAANSPDTAIDPPPAVAAPPVAVSTRPGSAEPGISMQIDAGGRRIDPNPRPAGIVVAPAGTPDKSIATGSTAGIEQRLAASAQPDNVSGKGLASPVGLSQPRTLVEASPLRQSPLKSAEIPARPHGGAAIDAATALDPRDALRPAQPVVKAAPETVINGVEPLNRNLEMSPPSTGAQPLTSASVPAAPVAASGPVNAAPMQQSALPPQLESMSLARSAAPAEWSDGLSERVSWMINQKRNSATIRLDPPMLGKLDVQIRIADEATTITIQTQHAQTRDLIETASARLRDFLQENGYQNVNVDVSQRQDQQQSRAQGSDPDHADAGPDAQAEHESGESQPWHATYSVGEGLLDTFA